MDERLDRYQGTPDRTASSIGPRSTQRSFWTGETRPIVTKRGRATRCPECTSGGLAERQRIVGRDGATRIERGAFDRDAIDAKRREQQRFFWHTSIVAAKRRIRQDDLPGGIDEYCPSILQPALPFEQA